MNATLCVRMYRENSMLDSGTQRSVVLGRLQPSRLQIHIQFSQCSKEYQFGTLQFPTLGDRSLSRKNTPELGTLESLLWNAVRGTRASALVAQTPKFKRLSFPPGLSLLRDLPRTYDVVVPPRQPSDRSLLRSNDARITSILDFPRLTPSHGLFTRFFHHWQIPALELLIDAINRFTSVQVLAWSKTNRPGRQR